MLHAIVILTDDPDSIDIIRRDDSATTISLGAAKPIDAVRKLLQRCTAKEIYDLRVGDLAAIQRRTTAPVAAESTEG